MRHESIQYLGRTRSEFAFTRPVRGNPSDCRSELIPTKINQHPVQPNPALYSHAAAPTRPTRGRIGGTMKALVISLLIALPSAANAEHPELRLVQRGTESTLHDSDLLLKLIAVVESASVESTAYAHPAEKWERGLS